MSPIVDDKKYSNDVRAYSDVAVNDGFVDHFDESPVSKLLKVKDICIYKPGVPKPGIVLTEDNFKDPNVYSVLPDANKNGKWGKTSWDSFSYALLMSHNVWTHIEAVQRANREFDSGQHPAMMRYSGPRGEFFEDIVERIFAAPSRAAAEDIIEYYNKYWMEIVGTRGFKGKKTVNANSMFDALYEYVEPELDQTKLDTLEAEND